MKPLLPIALAASFALVAPACRRAAQSGPSDEAIHKLNAGIALLEQHRFGQAEGELKQALALHPDYKEAHFDLALAYAAGVKYPEAEQELDKVLAADPKDAHALYLRGLIRKYKGEKDKAIADFDGVLAVDPDDTDTKYNLASLHKDKGEYDQAIPLLEQVIASAPYFTSAYYAIGQAYLRAGQEKKDETLVAKGQEYIEKFQKLSGGIAAETAGMRYGEQGRYAMAVEDASPPPAAAPAAFKFEEAAAKSGLAFRHKSPEGPLGTLGGGVLLFDVDGDGDVDAVLAEPEGGGPARLLRNQGGGRFAEAADGLAAVEGTAPATAAGDVDNDGKVDLFLAGHLLRGDGAAFTDVGAASGIDPAAVAGYAGCAFADLDHDGDLDLVLAYPDGRGLRALRNDGKGKFEDVTEAAGLASADKAVSLAFTDFDNDRDVDLLVGVDGGAPRLYSNDRGLHFTDVAAKMGLAAGGATRAVLAADLDGDGYPELLITNAAGGGATLYRNRRGAGFQAEPLATGGEAAGAVFLDADLDGDLDLVLAAGGKLRFFRNDGTGKLSDESAAVGLDGVSGDVRGLAAADVDGDGDLDLVGNVRDGAALLLLNRVAETAKPSWVQVLPRGLNSNKSALGAKVEVRSGRIHQKLEVQGASGFLSQGPSVLTFGLDGREAVDRVRFLWPGGVLQAETDLKPRAFHAIEELDRKGSSCPFLWAFDGDEVRFVSDIQGGSPLGLWLAPGVTNTPDADEWFVLPDGAAKPRDGAYDLRVSESLEEVCYLDRVMLRVVDAPAQARVFTNERLLLAPPFAPYRLQLVDATRPPLAARDGDGHDVREALLDVDRHYAGSPGRDGFRGFSRPWSLTLDFGTVAPAERGKPLLLLAHGYVEFSNSTPMFAAAQQGRHLELPALDLIDSQGRVAGTIADAGAPAGLPKWMVLDLTDKLPSDGRLLLRYRTSLEVYFDQVLLGSVDPSLAAEVHDLEPATAELRFAGYPSAWDPDGGRPILYRYAPLLGDETWGNQVGLYTRFGDVRPLLAAEDDLPVVMAHGDELALTFPAAALPPLRPGYARHLVLYSVGYAKDLDPHSALPFTVGPLPYRAMPSYPYDSAGRFAEPAYQAALANWSTRYVGERSSALR